MAKQLPLLNPIKADTPLAALFNQFMAAQAPALALTTKYPSQTKRNLASLTNALHVTHTSLVGALKKLEQGTPVEELAKYFSYYRGRPGIGCAPENMEFLLAYVCLPERITTSARIADLNTLTAGHLRKLITSSGRYAPLCGSIEAALKAGRAAENEWWQVGRIGGLSAQGIATVLRALLNADFNGGLIPQLLEEQAKVDASNYQPQEVG